MSGIFAQQYNADGTTNGTEFQVNTFTTSGQQLPGVAIDSDGDFIITWESAGSQDGDGFGVFARLYNADGTTNGTEFQVNTFTTDSQNKPEIAIDGDGDFIITWVSNGQDGDRGGIYAQRYNADGTTNGTEFQVNTFTTDFQSRHAIAANSDGDFVISWTSDNQDGDFNGIFAQRYNADGTTNGTEFLVNTFTTSFQGEPAVAIDNEGDFIITWGSLQDGDGYGIYAQRYNADGTTNGTEFRVNTFTTGSQRKPAIIIDSEGDFLISWEGFGDQDGNFGGIFAQRYNADGTTNGTEFQVNTFTTSNQLSPEMALDSDGNFVIAWEGGGNQDGSNSGIFAQRFEVPILPIIGTSGDDDLTGTDGDDTMRGEEGNDTVNGGAGNDSLQGNGGDDIVIGGLGNDTLKGNTGRDILQGGSGDDSLNGNNGNDTLDGGTGNDTLIGGADNDLLIGDVGDDLLNGQDDNDILIGGVGNDTLFGVNGKDTLEGSNGNDSLLGGNDKDLLDGGTGNDTLLGQDDDDFLHGQTGNDSLDGGDGNDSLDGGDGLDTLNGSNGKDTLKGGDGNDSLLGGNNDDLLFGGPGLDSLTGGNGNDRFALVSGVTADGDLVQDFDDGIDQIFLTGGLTFGKLTITQNVANTDIIETDSNQTLMTLIGTNTGDIDATDFV
ncbi:MAG: hypothetical protein AAGA80_09110 [Cyanobacteria bacterium P01_F01_bin.143]